MTAIDEQITIYVYEEHTARAGQVCLSEDASDDEVLRFIGTARQLAADARHRLAVRYDRRPGGAGDSFEYRCARAILAYLGEDR